MIHENPSVAVVGSGYWGQNLVRNFYNLGALKIVCDKNPEALARLRGKYPGLKATTSFTDALTDPEVKGVVIATPAETHGQLTRLALLAGKDVFVEKPICLSVTEGEELIALSRERGLVLMVGHLLWYHPVVRKLKELIVEGELGQIFYIYSNRLNMGKLRREENVLWSFAPHDLSLIMGLLDEKPTHIQAQGGNYLHHEIADVTVTTLNFPSGVKSHVFVSWLHPYKEQKLVVVGQKKMAVFDDSAPWGEKLQLFAHKVEWPGNVPVAFKAEAEIVSVGEEEPLKLECQQFLHCIHTRSRPLTDGEEALRVIEVLTACQKALENGGAVAVGRPKEAKKEKDFSSHETAIIDVDVEIGAGTKIWHFSHIMSGSRIGERCNVGQNVVIGPRVSIGHGCKIQNNISIYEGVRLEDEVFCGPSMVFTNVFNPRAHIKRMSELRPTLVKRGATIGANATIVCGHTLGEYCFIGAGAVVTRDVPAYALMVGNPAVQKGWMCACGVRLYDDLTCPACGAAFKLSASGLDPIHRLGE